MADTFQDTKYKFTDDVITNRYSGEVIPADEPVFLFRARDSEAVGKLTDYAEATADPEHKKAVLGAVARFRRFAEEFPERMKQPDTDFRYKTDVTLGKPIGW